MHQLVILPFVVLFWALPALGPSPNDHRLSERPELVVYTTASELVVYSILKEVCDCPAIMAGQINTHLENAVCKCQTASTCWACSYTLCCKDEEDSCWTVSTVHDQSSTEAGTCNSIPPCVKETPETCCFKWTAIVEYDICCSGQDPTCDYCGNCCFGDADVTVNPVGDPMTRCGTTSAQTTIAVAGNVTVVVTKEIVCEATGMLKIEVYCPALWPFKHTWKRDIECKDCESQ